MWRTSFVEGFVRECMCVLNTRLLHVFGRDYRLAEELLNRIGGRVDSMGAIFFSPKCKESIMRAFPICWCV